MRRTALLGGAIAATLGMAGCRHHWTIDMRVEGTKVHREVIVDRQEGDSKPATFAGVELGPPASIVSHLESIYGNHALRRRRGADQVFEADFDGVLPNDVGGAGSVTTVVCPFGRVTTYRERIGGSDHPAALLEHRLWAADRLADVVAAALETRLRAVAKPEDAAELERVLGFLRGRFRSDVRDLALAFSPSKAKEPMRVAPEILADRGYVTSDEAAVLKAAGGLSLIWAPLWGEEGQVLLRRIIGRGLGLPAGAPLPSPWDRADVHHVTYAVDAETVREMEAWECPGTPKLGTTRRFDDREAFEALVTEHVLGLTSTAGRQTVEVSLSPPVRAMVTDGQQDAASARIVWTRAEVPSPYEEPLLLSATWVQPDAATQTARLGSVLLEGRRLFVYALWRATLRASERARWDAAVSTFVPGPDLRRQITSLRLEQGKADALFQGGRLLLWAMGEPPAEYREGGDPFE